MRALYKQFLTSLSSRLSHHFKFGGCLVVVVLPASQPGAAGEPVVSAPPVFPLNCCILRNNIFCYYFYRLSGRFIQIYVNKIFRSVFEDKVLSFLTVAAGRAAGWEREQSQKTKCLELSSYEFVELMKLAWPSLA